MTRCTKVTPHRCTLSRHLSTAPEPRVLPMPLAVVALCLAFAALLASGGWRA